MLAFVDHAQRFTVREGCVVCPPEVGWLHTRPAATVDPVVAERLRQAQVAEFGLADAAAARAQFDELLGPMGPRGDAALPVALAAAWQAHRAGDVVRRDALALTVAEDLAQRTPADLADPRLAERTAGLLLLDAARAIGSTPAATGLVPALPASVAGPLLERLLERGQPVAALRGAHERLDAWRTRLLAVHGQLQHLDVATPRAVAGSLLLWFPDAEHAGEGEGALVEAALLQQLIGLGTARPAPVAGLPPIPDAEGLRLTAPTGEAEDVVPDLAWIVPAAVPAPAWFARPAAVVAATLTLVFVFGGSLWFALRAVRREALAMRARSEFLTGVTHELKTPIASIRLVADVLTDDDVPPPKQREYFALLAGESARLSMLIDNVLDLGQMERGERAYDLRPGDLAAVVREAVRLFAPLAQRAAMPLVLREGLAAAPATVDEGALRQALLAVFENARKYAAAGGALAVTTARDGRAFTVAVRDFGPGVPAAEAEAVFARFQRGSLHRHGSVPGVGLGLHLARSIVQRHGGTLVCKAPDDGAGALFVFTLPLAEESHA